MKIETFGTADSTPGQRVEATLTADAYTPYTASVVLNGQTYRDTHNVTKEGTILAAVRNAAKTELQNYKDPANYRAAQQAELNEEIGKGGDAIDAAGDINAVALALAAAKIALDAIQTDAQLTAGELAAAEELTAAKEEYEAFRETAKTGAEALRNEGDSSACQALVEAAKAAIAAREYDESKSIDANKAALEAILEQLGAYLTALRNAEASGEEPEKPTEEPEKPTEQPEKPVVEHNCGKLHDGSIVDNFIGLFHRIVHILVNIFSFNASPTVNTVQTP